MKRLTEDQCRAAMETRDFGLDVRGAGETVAVVLTQSWCPQWVAMRSWLDAAERDSGSEVFLLEYDLEPFFDEFMEFKETVFGNRSVPYVRYYRNGVLISDSNYLSKDGFQKRLRG
ncbi:MAG TPA: hypothetical protein PK625_03150 [Spirochaetales bacterium]|nr:hypothetical protein [Spirochaetales bacterium]MBP7262968.1 hypothetical protein [Spirochaetia bacterium]HPE36119.1 hypothetical protein [Spirochaetales bacterium]